MTSYSVQIYVHIMHIICSYRMSVCIASDMESINGDV